MIQVNKVLIVGLFRSNKTINKIPCSAPEQMADLFKKNGIPVITTSIYLGRFLRFFDTVFTILANYTQYDVAIVPWFNGKGSYYWQEIASRLLKLLGKKIVLVIRGGGIPDLLDKHPKKYMKTLQRANHIICPSAFIASRLINQNIPSEVIANSLNLNKYPFIRKEQFSLNLLWMRTLEPLYNPAMALKVAKILKDRGHKFTLHIAGQNNGHLKELEALRTAYNVEQEVVFCGFINHEQKLKLARSCDMYLCTNRVDNAPVSLIEMMCLGLPIVSTNVGGIPNFIKNGENGLLVNDNDAEAMVESILEIHQNPTLGRMLVENGYHFSRQFDELSVLEKWKYYINTEEFYLSSKTSLQLQPIEYNQYQISSKVVCMLPIEQNIDKVNVLQKFYG